jgi:ABC-type branched-subunit amino acid transport system ATPase component
LQSGAPAQLQPMLASVLLLAILALGGDGLVPLLLRWRPVKAARVPASALAAPREPATLNARGLWKSYGGVDALAGLDLDVAPGEAVALVGANGSGKTTALRALAGALPLDRGEVSLDGRPLAALEPSALAEAGVVRTLQRTSTFPTLTALENTLVGAGLHAPYTGPVRSLAATPKSRAESRQLASHALDALRLVRLEELATTRAELLDGFQQRLLMIASALAARPRLLLLDEPSAGAGRQEVEFFAELLREIRASGISLLVVEHNLRLVRAFADRIVVMADGRAVE